MNTLSQRLFVNISLIFIVVLLVYFFGQLSIVRQKNIDPVQLALNGLVADFTTEESFTERAMPVTTQPQTRLLALFTLKQGIVGLWAVNEGYLESGIGDLGRPQLSVAPVFETELTATNPLSEYRASAVVRVFSNTDLQPTLITTLYFILGYAAFAVLILFSSIITNRRGKRSRLSAKETRNNGARRASR